ncbi:MAG: AAA family ATPase [Promethearchaeati archaeon SRVP18_Atabeyarchaeia-1]
MQRRIFSITGVHGSGKTTVYNSLRALHTGDPNWIFMPERRGHPPYPFGSKDPQIAFRAELWYLRQMLQRNGLIREQKENGAIIMCDRSPICILAYSHALCSPGDYRIIRDLYFGVDWMEDATFYLQMNLESTISRLTSGRRKNLSKWNEGDETYILKVLDGYERAFKEVKENKRPRLIRVPNFNAKPKETIQRIDQEILGEAVTLKG